MPDCMARLNKYLPCINTYKSLDFDVNVGHDAGHVPFNLISHQVRSGILSSQARHKKLSPLERIRSLHLL